MARLGGLSLLAYVALESTNFDTPARLYSTWNVNVGKELERTLDRVDDLEMMCNQLVTFVEMQKDQIARLKRGEFE